MTSSLARRCVILSLVALCAQVSADDIDHTIHLTTGAFAPQPIKSLATAAAADVTGQHILIQFERILTDGDRAMLQAEGIHLLDYIPHFAYTARVHTTLTSRKLGDFGIRWFDKLQPHQKISPLLTTHGIPSWSIRGGDSIQITVVLHADVDLVSWVGRLESQWGAHVLGIENSARSIEFVLPTRDYSPLASEDGIMWIEPSLPPQEEHNDNARSNIGATTLQAAPFNLTGNGVMLSEWDGGRADVSHGDFGGRVISADGAALSTHATHVAGTVLGSGSQSSGTYKGMAPSAQMLTQLWWGSGSEASNEYTSAISIHGAEIATNSWGYGVGSPATESGCQSTLGNYFSVNTTLDNIVRGSASAPISICWSAGNQRSTNPDYCGAIGWSYGTVSPPGTGKNLITVGAINSNNSTMTGFSSWGPTDDGRIKPDVVGPGCQSTGDGGLTSTKLTSGYTTFCGTSMSTPATAGVLALMKEHYNLTIGGANPLPSTMKGILINTAIDLGAAGPDFAYGHGKVDAVGAVDKIGDGSPSWVQGQISTGQNQLYDLTVPSGTTKLKVTLVWDDPGGVGLAGKDLINDIDLTLIDPLSASKMPWVLNPVSPSSPATTGTDRTNNVETVEINNPLAGLWKAQISGFNIPNGPQKYSLVFTPDSIHTPGSLNAVEVFPQSDESHDPGTVTAVGFWISNIGASLDSVRVQISDNSGWVSSPKDTTVHLLPYDSAYVTVSATVPPSALAGATSIVSCLATSRSDTLVQDAGVVTLTAAAVYIVHLLDPPAPDTVTSPGSLQFSVRIDNSGNATDNIVIRPSDERGWQFTPATRTITLPTAADSVIQFTVNVPSAEPHLADNEILVTAFAQDSSSSDSLSFTLTTSNPLPPPALLSPDTSVYTNARVHTFSWTATGTTYKVYVASDSQLTAVVRLYAGISSTSYTMPTADSLTDGVYYWAVRAFTGSDSSSLQAFPFVIGVDNSAPSGAQLLSPADNILLTTTSLSLTYAPIPGSGPIVAPEYYTIQIAHDSLFTNTLTTYDFLQATTHPLTAIGQGRWYWRVRRGDMAGNQSAYSAARDFLIDTEAPIVPTLAAPADGESITGNSVLFTWDGTPPSGVETSQEYYYVHVSNNPQFTDFTTFNAFIYTDSLTLFGTQLQAEQTYYWRVKSVDSAGFYSNYSVSRSLTYSPFICGDVDGDQSVDIADLTRLIEYLFLGGSAPEPFASGAIDCGSMDENIDISDLTQMISHLFLNGEALCCN